LPGSLDRRIQTGGQEIRRKPVFSPDLLTSCFSPR
jgi:hypothetical protein